MEYRIVINACSDTFRTQAGELNAFISTRLLPQLTTQLSLETHGKTIIFHDGTLDVKELSEVSPTPEVTLIKLNSYLSETALKAFSDNFEADEADLWVFAGDHAGAELSVRLSFRFGGSALTMVTGMEGSGRGRNAGGLRCRRAVYSGYLTGLFSMKRKPWCISIAKGVFESVMPDTGMPRRTAEIEAAQIEAAEGPGQAVISSSFTREECGKSLENAPFIISAGRGVGGREQCLEIAGAAREMSAAFGVTRVAAMNGWAPINQMIGASGAVTSPELCISLGASGSAAYMSGLKKSGFLVAVNTDPKAPIVGQSDVAVIEDYKAFIDALRKIIREEGK
jgi:electron transfer flavoprotein alpha subunit